MASKVFWALAIFIACFAPAKGIIGGENAARNEFPWQVLLEATGSFGEPTFCSGALVELDLVLTSASCVVMKSSNISVYAGSQYFSQNDGSRQNGKAKEVIMHEHYNQTTQLNDLALIRLNQKFTQTESVRTINLPPADYDPELSGNGTIAGWGVVNVTSGKNEMSEELLKSTVSIKGSALCSLTGVKAPQGQFCTTGKKGGYLGDFGGPLICQKLPNAVCGILSIAIFNPKNVAIKDADVAGGYVDVPLYVDWISQHFSKSHITSTQTPSPSFGSEKTSTVTDTKPAPAKSQLVLGIFMLLSCFILIVLLAAMIHRMCTMKRRHMRLRESVVDLTPVPEFDFKPYTISNRNMHGGDEHDA